MLKKDFLLGLRKKEQLTRSEIENLTGVPSRTIGAYERGELNITKDAEYANAISAISGISPDIFAITDISDEDINNNMLTIFSQRLRQLMLWTNMRIEHLIIQDTPENDIFNWLINAKCVQNSVVFKAKHVDYLDNFISAHGLFHAMEYANKEVGSIVSLDVVELIDNECTKYYSIFFFQEAFKIILHINRFRPSSLGISLENFSKIYSEVIPRDRTVIFGHQIIKMFDDLLGLEKNSLEFNYENVKYAMTHGTFLNDEQKKLFELWGWASDKLKKEIFKVLQDNKDNNIKLLDKLPNLSK